MRSSLCQLSRLEQYIATFRPVTEQPLYSVTWHHLYRNEFTIYTCLKYLQLMNVYYNKISFPLQLEWFSVVVDLSSVRYI